MVAERLGAKIEIGQNTFIGNSSIIAAEHISIGDDVLISWGCTIVDHHSHSTNWNERSQDVRMWYNGKKDWSAVRISPVRIGNKVWIGFNSIVLAGVTIGEGAVIGCGSIVTKDVAPFTVVAGVPAKPNRNLNDVD